MSKKGQRQRRRLQAPPSGQEPSGNLAARDLDAMAEELTRYHAQFHDLFQRRQQGVFAAYVSHHGYTFVDRRLYLPEEWFDDAHAPLRQRYGVPPELRFQT